MAIAISKVLDKLETHYGKQLPLAPTDPYEFLVWWHCGYPASEDRCSKGWESVTRRIGIKPHELLSAKTPQLSLALKAGGMVPALRAARLREIAQRTQEEFAGNLGPALARLDAAKMRKVLKSFPVSAIPAQIGSCSSGASSLRRPCRRAALMSWCG